MRPDDIELWSLDPSQNRFRVYAIREERTLFGEPCLVVAWGRLGRPLRERTEIFTSGGALSARRSALVALRTKHGYFAPAMLGGTRAVLFGASVLPATRPMPKRARSPGGQMTLGLERGAA
jgi:predicted DNA-binding WGR domain protein